MSSNSNKNLQNKTKKNDKGPKYHRWNEKLQKYVILKEYQLPKDLDHEGFRLMPSDMRKLLSDEEFKKYGNITISTSITLMKNIYKLK